MLAIVQSKFFSFACSCWRDGFGVLRISEGLEPACCPWRHTRCRAFLLGLGMCVRYTDTGTRDAIVSCCTLYCYVLRSFYMLSHCSYSARAAVIHFGYRAFSHPKPSTPHRSHRCKLSVHKVRCVCEPSAPKIFSISSARSSRAVARRATSIPPALRRHLRWSTPAALPRQ